jgi:two-component system, NarL family, response regulator DesR
LHRIRARREKIRWAVTKPIIKVLLADDYPGVREAFRSLLRSHEDIYVVAEAINGRDAVAAALRLVPDVVVLDISMPLLDGIEVTRRIVRANPAIAILIVSAGDASVAGKAVSAGARGYLSKPLAAAKLPEAIRALAAGRTYPDEVEVSPGEG